jgi:hypothetical protein
VLPLVLAVIAVGSPPVVTGCEHTAHVRPAAVTIACADANFYFTGLRWTRWGSRDAVAVGVAHLNDCTPYCAAGHFHAYRGELRLSRPAECLKGRREFSRFDWRFTAAKPAQVPRADGFVLQCGFLKLHP